MAAGPIVRYLEVLYRKMQEAGASIIELELGSQERIVLKRRQRQEKLCDPSLQKESPIPSGSVKITAPLSGVFYQASSPSSAPFVEVGKRVAIGDILCIIEAMKVMNEIKATVSGRVLEILDANGKHVKKGDALFVIDTTHAK